MKYGKRLASKSMTTPSPSLRLTTAAKLRPFSSAASSCRYTLSGLIVAEGFVGHLILDRDRQPAVHAGDCATQYEVLAAVFELADVEGPVGHGHEAQRAVLHLDGLEAVGTALLVLDRAHVGGLLKAAHVGQHVGSCAG